MLSWFKNRRRRRLLAQPFPQEWLAILRSNVRHYLHLPAAQQDRVRQIVQVTVAEKEWAGVRGLAVTDEMKVTIAGYAAVMASGYDEPYFFDRLQTIVIHPRTIRFTADQSARNPWLPRPGPMGGVAWHRGPVVVSWSAVRQEVRGHWPGHNVVMHEFAHHLDGLNGDVDGIPPLVDRRRQERWYAVTEAEYLRLVGSARRQEATLLDHYGASSRAEFFAVATECFFELPHALGKRHRELYETLADFYRQNPRQWLPRLEASPEGGGEPGGNVALGSRGQSGGASEPAPELRDGRRPAREERLRLGALRTMPADEALFALGLEHIRWRRSEDAVRVFTSLVEADPRDEEALAQRAIAYLQLGSLPQARADSEAALAIDPADVDALRVRGEVALRQGNPQAALDDLDAAVLESPSSADIRLSRGRALFALGQPRRAFRDLNRAVYLDPRRAEAYLERARALEALGQTGRAQQDYLRAQLLDPSVA